MEKPNFQNVKQEASSSSSMPQFSHDISRMPEFPPRNPGGHRRAQSEILTLPDDINFDADLGVLGFENDDHENEDDLFSMFNDMDKLENVENGGESSGGRMRSRHQHSMSMDGSSSVELDGKAASAEAKKAVSDAKLAELALVDPKRAKRILANRQSAARSKERKMRYIAELERKVQTLQTDATTLSAQLTLLQRDTTGLTTENSELKLRLQTMEQQVRLQDALNDTLRDQIQQLKISTGQVTANGGKVANYGLPSMGLNQQSYQRSHLQSLLASQQLQQLQIHPQHQQHMHLQQHQLHEHMPVDVKMKGIATSSSQNGSSSDGGYIPKNEA